MRNSPRVVPEEATLTCMRLADYAQFNSSSNIPFQRLIYGSLCAGFGDAVVCINVMRHFHSVTSVPINLSRWTIRKRRDRQQLYEDLLSVFRLKHICRVCDLPPTANIDHLNPLITERIISSPIQFLRSPLQWEGANSSIITYQFDGLSFGDLKAPSETDLQFLRGATLGYEMVLLGKHLSVQENIALLAASRCFVGIDSGVAQLAYSVGVPMFLMRNGHFFAPNHAPHMSRKAVIGDSGRDIAAALRHFLGVR